MASGTAPNALAQTEAVLALVCGPQIGQAWVTTVNDVDDAAQWSGGRYEAFRDQMLATTTTHGHYFNVTSIRRDRDPPDRCDIGIRAVYVFR